MFCFLDIPLTKAILVTKLRIKSENKVTKTKIMTGIRQKSGQSGQGQNGHFHFWIRSFAHYNNKYIFIIIVGILTSRKRF